MLSYRHGFHAGNHADVLKHMVLCLLLRALNEKDKPYTVIDTHAGAGIYDMTSAFARKNSEFTSGWLKVAENGVLQELVPEYYEAFDKAQKEPYATRGQMYPGSPFIEYCLARQCDSIFLNDAHKAEFESLLQIFKRKRNVRVELRQCQDTINALLPPLKKRGLILIDPPYENEQEYRWTVDALKRGLGRFEQGIYAIWYPVLGRLHDHSKNLVQQVKRLNRPLLQVELRVTEQQEEYGMCGSGLLIINYPYMIDHKLEPIIGELYQSLCDPNLGSAKLEIINAKA